MTFQYQISHCNAVTGYPTRNSTNYPTRKIWVAKIRRNQERDRKNYRVLQENGWQVIVVWECQLTPKKLEHTMREVALLLEENMLSLYKRPTPLPYSTEEEGYLPIAAEVRTPYGE